MSKTDQEHALNHGYSCPSCDEVMMEGTDMDISPVDGKFHIHMECSFCGANWRDVFKLVGYDSLNAPQENF